MFCRLLRHAFTPARVFRPLSGSSPIVSTLSQAASHQQNGESSQVNV